MPIPVDTQAGSESCLRPLCACFGAAGDNPAACRPHPDVMFLDGAGHQFRELVRRAGKSGDVERGKARGIGVVVKWRAAVG